MTTRPITVVSEGAFDTDDDEPQPVHADRDRRFGRYQLRYQLAAGGMATVYLAKSIGPAQVERAVALKRIHDHLARKRSFVEMFLDEARIASRINHPNVCTVLDFGEVGGAYYLAMEYLLGEPLCSVIRVVSQREELVGSRRWRALAARIIADAAEGLHAAHRLKDEQGLPLSIVHRDVSLSNVFVAYSGAVKVLDFGIATAATKLHRTRTGVVKGTYAYVAPEQFVGGDVDCRADVWGLGVCLWELLVGTRLFKRTTEMETMLAVCSEEIPDPRSVRPDVPDELAKIVMHALQRDREDRFPSARAMSQALSRYIVGSEEPTGLAELEEWMQDLFGEARTTKQALRDGILAERFHDAETGALVDADAPTTQLSPVSGTDGRHRRTSPLLAITVFLGVAFVATLATLIGVLVRDADEDPPFSGTVPTVVPAPPPVSPPLPAADEPVASEEGPRPSPDPVDEPPEPAPETEDGSEGERTAMARDDEARPPPRPRPAVSYGHVNVSTPGGWADVYADGRRLGRTPIRIRLRTGRRTVSLRPFGRSPGIRRVIQVDEDRVGRLVLPVSN